MQGRNPLLSLWERHGSSEEAANHRAAAVGRYAHAVPTREAITCLAVSSPRGIIEVGAGAGYWAWLLAHHGVDVVAYDIDPPDGGPHHWFPDVEPWHPVITGDETCVVHHPERTLLLVWPTRDAAWSARAAALHHGAGGHRLAYVGEPAGGRTGDDRLHALLGGIEACLQCRYGINSVPCICSTAQLWRLHQRVELPHWPGFEDDLLIFERLDE